MSAISQVAPKEQQVQIPPNQTQETPTPMRDFFIQVKEKVLWVWDVSVKKATDFKDALWSLIEKVINAFKSCFTSKTQAVQSENSTVAESVGAILSEKQSDQESAELSPDSSVAQTSETQSKESEQVGIFDVRDAHFDGASKLSTESQVKTPSAESKSSSGWWPFW